jgi:tRNA acetyltransferase TAN1
LLDDFNLLVSSARGDERDANSELQYLLGELGDRAITTSYTPVSGLTVAKTELEPVRVIGGLRAILRTRPWEFRYILKVRPVIQVVRCTMKEIEHAVAQQVQVIGDRESFRISIEKRQSSFSSKDVIDTVASKIPRKVNLQNPHKIVLIEIISQLAGVSIIEPGCILGVEREKRVSIFPSSVLQSAR